MVSQVLIEGLGSPFLISRASTLKQIQLVFHILNWTECLDRLWDKEMSQWFSWYTECSPKTVTLTKVQSIYIIFDAKAPSIHFAICLVHSIDGLRHI